MASAWKSAFALKPPVVSVPDALRLVGPTLVILTGLSLAGHYLLGLLIALGTYTVLFGGVPDRRHRFMVMSAAGAGLLAAVTVGMVVHGSLVWTLVAYTGTTFAAAILDEVIPLGPPGPAFFVLMVGAGVTVGAAPVQLGQVLPPVVIGTVIALLAAMAGRSRPASSAMRGHESLPGRLRKRWSWGSSHAVTLTRILLAVVTLTLIAYAVSDSHPFWSVLVALLVLSYPGETGVLIVRAASRVAGTVIGVGVYWLWSLVGVPTEWDFVAIGLMIWATSRLAPRNYAYASIVITLLALLMTQPLVRDVGPGSLALNRLADTALAAAVCMGAIALVRTRPERIATGPQ